MFLFVPEWRETNVEYNFTFKLTTARPTMQDVCSVGGGIPASFRIDRALP